MSSFDSKGQEVISCDLCSHPTHQHFCNDCQTSLCTDCVSEHVDKLKSQTHDIVPFKDRKQELIFTPCPFHQGQRCEAHCKQCDVNVCIKCILGNHASHPVLEMAEAIKKKKDEIEQETHEIQSVIIPKFRKEKEKSKSNILESEARCAELRKEVEIHRKLWHQEVDEVFDKMISKIKFMTDKHITALKIHQSKLRSMLPNMFQTIEKNREILKNYSASALTDHKSRLHEFQDIPSVIDITIHELNTITNKGTELSIELGDFRASLTQMTLTGPTDDVSTGSLKALSEKATVVANIPTKLKNLRSLECVGADEAWVSGEDKTVRCFDIHGSERDAVTTTCPIAPNDIAVNQHGELLYCDGHNKTVNIVRNYKTETLFTTPQGWHPDGLCCTRSGDILVSLGTTDFQSRKIVSYEGTTLKQEMDKDDHGNPIFKGGEYALYVAENNNGDICASDQNADSLVVMDNSGKIRFRYDGTPVRKDNHFSPRQIATDSLSQIIVADARNNSLHILDQNAQMLRYVEDSLLERPIGLSVDSQGRLWVGLLSGDIKVIQYIK
ncbi:E3 ubiquitin-protein ligase TRIM71-like [Saccostrea echinata]|uniref:E3 ubiquitin-protein ligase TRIM71-like n=1 Tax=Saccostrea echinata TaxID=191078 RepID=UPI002A7F69B0|nr:E3 ubiquitin-protein ligase TRIM71-like [Saccostrea echinata]